MNQLKKTLKFAAVQLKVGSNKVENVARAIEKIREAKRVGGDSLELIVLPECFNSPYGSKYFPEYAEEIPDGHTSTKLAEICKELGVYLIAGSIPERRDSKLFNTATVWSPQGSLITTYSKTHLFDIDIPGEITFKESETLSAGKNLTTLTIGEFKIGIGICYDIRFEELAKLYRKQGCNVLIYPGAFNMKTGPLHWELLARSRANDNQCYMSVVSPARDESADYVAWGHSMVVDPWAKVIAKASTEEEIIFAECDLDIIQGVRRNIPIFSQRRVDIYDTVEK